MQHDYDGRIWADQHSHLSAAISAAFDKLSYTFERLTAHLYDAPWDRTKH